VLAGTVERVTFHNAETGFCVLRVKSRGQRDLIVLVGHSPAIGAGEFVTASGAWVTDRSHGLQFKANCPTSAPVRQIGAIHERRISGSS